MFEEKMQLWNLSIKNGPDGQQTNKHGYTTPPPTLPFVFRKWIITVYYGNNSLCAVNAVGIRSQ